MLSAALTACLGLVLWAETVGSVFSFQTFNRTDLMQVYYIGFSSNRTGSDSASFTYSQHLFKNVSSADDSPFETLTLPFDKFVVFGRKVQQLFVNPNGALHISPAYPVTPSNIFIFTGQDFSNTYYGTIAGFLTDLNCGNSSGNVSAIFATPKDTSHLAHVSVYFDSIKIYATTHAYTFEMVLFEDSRVEFRYDQMYFGPKYPERPYVLSGLRPPKNDVLTHFDVNQTAFGKSEWGTSVVGLYAPRRTLKQEAQFTACPISLSWCLSPSEIVLSRDEEITLTTLLLSCLDLLDYRVYVSQTAPRVGSSINPGDASLLPCNATSVGGDTMVRLNCTLSAVARAQLTAGRYQVTPVWQRLVADSFDSDRVYTVLPVASMNLTVTSSSAVGTCEFNEGLSGDSSSTCSGCDLCHLELSCLGLPCSETTAGPPITTTPSLFEWPTCNNTCTVNATAAGQTFYTDTAGVCCTLDQMDCGGKCFGPAAVGLNGDGDIYCCPTRARLDCAGVCDGSTFCFDYKVSVVPTTSLYASGALNVPFNTSDEGNPISFAFNITNESNAKIVVEFSVPSDDRSKAPIILLPATQVLNFNKVVLVTASISLHRLFTGNMTSFVEKTIQVKYYPQAHTNDITLLTFPVRVSTTNCAALTGSGVIRPRVQHGADACMRLPGCMYCLANADVRVLRSVDEGSGVNGGSRMGRRLFDLLLPPSADNNDDRLLDGFCIDSWLTEDCLVSPLLATSSAAGGRGSFRFALAVVIVLLHVNL